MESRRNPEKGVGEGARRETLQLCNTPSAERRALSSPEFSPSSAFSPTLNF
ncbi:unnamed protein product, partial [Nesidiocoris tenuis]